jgi:ribosomal protein L21
MSDTQQVTNESKNVNEEKTSIINGCDKEELKVDTAVTTAAPADADKMTVIPPAVKTAVIDTKVTSTICKQNVKKNKKNKKKHNRF